MALFTLVLLMMSPQVLYSQILTDKGYIDVAETADQSAAVSSLNQSVDLASGTVSIVIPIVNLQTNDQNIPVTVRYQTSGIKVTDLNNGPVGLGWNLGGAGKIVRIIRAVSDIRWPLKHFDDIDQLWADAENGYSFHNYESDLYFFEMPSASGLFILDSDLNPVTVPYQGVKIEWHSDGTDSGYFTIIDPAGNTCVFGKTAQTREETTLQTHYSDYSNDPYTYISTWYLDSVESLKGEKVEYSYKTGEEYSYDSILELYDYQKHGNEAYSYWASGSIRTEMTVSSPKQISEITWDDKVKVLFGWNKGNITEISLECSNMPAAATDLNVSFGYSGNSGSSLLTSISRNGRQIYGFDYYNATSSVSKDDCDWWGYYNSTGGNAGDYENEEYSPDKSPKLEFARYHALKSISYPDGGSVTYSYELNDGYTENGEFMQVGGLRISSVETDACDSVKNSVCYEYKKADGKSSGVLFASKIKTFYETVTNQLPTRHYANRSFNDLYDINQRNVTYSVVRVVDSEKISENTFTSAADDDCKDVVSKIYRYHRETASQLINSPDSVYENVRPFSEGNVDFCNTSRFWRRGLLKSSRIYDLQGNLFSEHAYEYDFGQNPLSEVENYQYYLNRHNSVIGTSYIADTYVSVYRWLSEPVLVKKVTTYEGPHSLHSVTSFRYDYGHLTPLYEETKDCLGSRWTRQTKYPFSYSQIDTSMASGAALNWLKEKDLAVPIETVWRKDGNLIKAEINEYGFHSWQDYAMLLTRYELNPDSLDAHYQPYNTSEMDSRFSPRSEYLYDTRGRIQRNITDGVTESFIYEDYKIQPVAKLRHASAESGNEDINQVYYNGFESSGEDLSGGGGFAKTGFRAHKGIYSTYVALRPGTYLMSYWTRKSEAVVWAPVREKVVHEGGYYSLSVGDSEGYVDEIRIHPLTAQMTTFTYWPSGEKATECDAGGKTSYYRYDESGRLLQVLDNDGNVLEEYRYNIKQ